MKNNLEFRADVDPTNMNVKGFSEGDLLLQALNGFVLVVTAEGYVFYASPTIQDYLGFHQSDMVHQSVFEFIHIDDRAIFRQQLHFALDPQLTDFDKLGTQSSSDITRNIVIYDPQHIPPENSSFLERSFVCRFRCLLDNSSGFLKLNFNGRLKFLLGQHRKAEDGSVVQPQLALFAIATPVQPPAILEIRTKTLLFQTKHKLDFTPMGIDSRGKVVLGYTEMELCMRGSGYQFIHAADMMHCADNHVRMIKTGESGMTVFRLLTKNGGWVWVQANARLVYKGGRPDFIISRQRALVDAEGEEHLRQRKMQLPFSFTTGEAVLYDTSLMQGMMSHESNSKDASFKSGTNQKGLDPSSLLASLQSQDKSIYEQDIKPQFTVDDAFRDSWALFNVTNHAVQEQATKEEDTIVSMINTLGQVAKDRDLTSALQQMEKSSTELKEWENALFRLTKDSNGNDKSFSLDEILTNDIFSYVEDALYIEYNETPHPQPNTTILVKPDPLAGRSEQSSATTMNSGCAFRDYRPECTGVAKNNLTHDRKLNPGMAMQEPVSAEYTERLSYANTDSIMGISRPRYQDATSPSHGCLQLKTIENTENEWSLQSSTMLSCQFGFSPGKQNKCGVNYLQNNYQKQTQADVNTVYQRPPLSPSKNCMSSDVNSYCPKFPQQSQIQPSVQWQTALPAQSYPGHVNSRCKSEDHYQNGFPLVDVPDSSQSLINDCSSLVNNVFHSPQNGQTADECSPLSSCMYKSHSPVGTITNQQHTQSQAVINSSYGTKTIPVGSIPQEDVCISPPSSQTTPNIDSHSVQRYLGCNGCKRVETHPVEETSHFSHPPLVNGVYHFKNSKTSCYSFPVQVSNIGGHQGLVD